MKPVIASAVILFSLAVIAQTTSSTQHVNLPLFIPCVNHGQGEVVNLSGRVRVLTSRYPTGDHGFSIYAGILTGKGNSTNHIYQAEGSNEAHYRNVVSYPNGNTGDFTFTTSLHLRDLSCRTESSALGMDEGKELLLDSSVIINVSCPKGAHLLPNARTDREDYH